jgi:F-type H+-transporting ATPase subunit b
MEWLVNNGAFIEGFVIKFDKDFIIFLLTQLFNTALLIGLLTKLLYNPVKNHLNNRAERIRNMISKAEEDAAAAEEFKAEYEAKIKEIDAERSDIMMKSHEVALRREEQIVLNAKRDAVEILARVDQEIDLERAKAKDEIKRQIIEVSALIAANYISKEVDEAEQKRIFTEALEGLEAAQW